MAFSIDADLNEYGVYNYYCVDAPQTKIGDRALVEMHRLFGMITAETD
ncbi:hypothetical protein KKA47_00940 [bacterium]|nr:hypothetical protein [bacterium]